MVFSLQWVNTWRRGAREETSMARVSGLELTLENWRDLLISLEEPPYRAEQIGDWIYRKKIFSFKDMTNLSQGLRQKLTDAVDLILPDLVKERTSLRDGTKKFLWRLGDGATVESVFLPHATHKTACLSSQVGCPLGCAFCATGKGGFVRDMTAGEITGHFLAMERHLGASVQNVVLMGMGEPLHNYDATVHAIQLMNCQEGLALSSRRITISTVGLVPQIDQLGKDFQGRIGLAISLHAADDAVRTRLLPINRRYPLQMLMQALRRYPLPPRRRLTIEIALIDGVNDSEQMARSLVALLRGIPVKINLIPLNPVPHTALRPPSEQRVEAFQEVLTRSGLSCFIRRRRGDDISAACGQLAGHPTSLIRQEPSPPRS